MWEIKAKVPICPRCGYGMWIRRKQKLCKACLDAEGNASAEKSLQAVKKQIASAPLSEAKTKNRTPKANRRKSRRKKT